MFGDWLIVFSDDNQLLRIYDNQDIAKDTEADDQAAPVIMVEKSDGTIDCIDHVLTAVDQSKPERLIQTRKKSHDKVRKEKSYEYVEYYRYCPQSCNQVLEDNRITCEVEVVTKKGDHIRTCQ